jgi:hypothetical protein
MREVRSTMSRGFWWATNYLSSVFAFTVIAGGALMGFES